VGYQARRTYRLEFEDPLYEGLVVDATSPTLDGYFQMSSLKEGLDENPDGLSSMVDQMAEYVASWNLETDGKLVPVDAAGLRSVDVDIVLAIIEAWLQVVSGASGPLGRRSRSGETSPEPSTTGQGNLSENQLSSLATNSSPLSA
jgi:hypothetical protein